MHPRTERSILRQAQINRRPMTQHVIIIERGSDGGYSAWAPDLPGVGVAASSYDEVVKLMGEATSPLRPVTSPSP